MEGGRPKAESRTPELRAVTCAFGAKWDLYHVKIPKDVCLRYLGRYEV